MGRTTTRIRKKPRWTDDQSRFIYRVLVQLLAMFFRFWACRLTIVGRHYVPLTGPLFLVANHTSAMDPLLVGYGAPGRLFRGPGKIELFSNPLFARILRKVGIFPLRQQGPDPAGVRTMVELYRAGGAVIVFPEGGRSKDGELQPFFPEFARLVLRLKARVVPAAIAGARDLLPMHHWVPRRGTAVVVVYGEPIDLSRLYDSQPGPEASIDAARAMEARVAGLLQQAREIRASGLARTGQEGTP